jgi:hypothetical protein
MKGSGGRRTPRNRRSPAPRRRASIVPSSSRSTWGSPPGRRPDRATEEAATHGRPPRAGGSLGSATEAAPSWRSCRSAGRRSPGRDRGGRANPQTEARGATVRPPARFGPGGLPSEDCALPGTAICSGARRKPQPHDVGLRSQSRDDKRDRGSGQEGPRRCRCGSGDLELRPGLGGEAGAAAREVARGPGWVCPALPGAHPHGAHGRCRGRASRRRESVGARPRLPPGLRRPNHCGRSILRREA